MKQFHDTLFGQVTFNDYFWECTNDIPFLGKDIVIYIDPEDRDHPAIGAPQRAVFQSIKNMPSTTKDVIGPAMFRNYLAVKDSFDSELPTIDGIDDVWNHVEVIHILIPMHRASKHQYFFIEFNCDWEEEHGLELLFKDGQLIRVDQATGLWGNAVWEQAYLNE